VGKRDTITRKGGGGYVTKKKSFRATRASPAKKKKGFKGKKGRKSRGDEKDEKRSPARNTERVDKLEIHKGAP